MSWHDRMVKQLGLEGLNARKQKEAIAQYMRDMDNKSGRNPHAKGGFQEWDKDSHLKASRQGGFNKAANNTDFSEGRNDT